MPKIYLIALAVCPLVLTSACVVEDDNDDEARGSSTDAGQEETQDDAGMPADGGQTGDGDGDGDSTVGDGDGDGDGGDGGDGDGDGDGGDGDAMWTCPQEWYGTNDGCDCGCGADDPDCGANYGIGACQYAEACGGVNFVDVNDPTSCAQASGGDGDGDGDGGESGEPSLLSGITAEHNVVRANVDPAAQSPLGSLTWSDTIANVAQNYAENCVWEHSNGGPYGENLYASTNAPSGPGVAQSWASEDADYNIYNNSCTPGAICGHYTAMVWSSTTELGCGVAHCTNGISGLPWSSGYIVVCNYDPPGNWVGQQPYTPQ